MAVAASKESWSSSFDGQCQISDLEPDVKNVKIIAKVVRKSDFLPGKFPDSKFFIAILEDPSGTIAAFCGRFDAFQVNRKMNVGDIVVIRNPVVEKKKDDPSGVIYVDDTTVDLILSVRQDTMVQWYTGELPEAYRQLGDHKNLKTVSEILAIESDQVVDTYGIVIELQPLGKTTKTGKPCRNLIIKGSNGGHRDEVLLYLYDEQAKTDLVENQIICLRGTIAKIGDDGEITLKTNRTTMLETEFLKENDILKSLKDAGGIIGGSFGGGRPPLKHRKR